MVKERQNFKLPQRNRNGTCFLVNLIMTRTVHTCIVATWPKLFTLLHLYYSTEHKKIEKLTATEPQPFHNVLLYLRMLCIVWSLVRRRVTRRPTGLQTMHNVL